MASSPIEIRQTTLPGVCVVVPKVFRDDRGFLLEAFNRNAFAAGSLPSDFVQDNHSRSIKGVLRGLHYQIDNPQGKLVRVARGKIFDVAVDIRRGSPTFGKWVGETLDDEDLRALWIPPGFAHGFCALSDVADVTYKCTAFYAPDDERGIVWNDPTLGIDWPLANPIVSAKDSKYPMLAEIRDLPSYNAD